MHIATRLAWGLDAAHNAGIIHRDLKPANVILSPDAEVGEAPKLIDFGLAKIAAVAGTEQLTRTGQIIGTPQYMSPEQISGREVDARSDVYALGLPALRDAARAAAVHRQRRRADALSPAARAARAGVAQRPHVPAELDEVIDRALAKDPHDRFGSVQELARALDAAVEKRRGAAAHGGDRAARRPRRRALPLAIAFVGGVALTVGAWAWRERASPRRSSRRRAPRRRRAGR